MTTTDDRWDPRGCQTRPRLSYVAGHRDAERRLRRGERQTLCRRCAKWRWKEELCQKSRKYQNSSELPS